jgi:tetratricopeptide (TPR) repeat protein
MSGRDLFFALFDQGSSNVLLADYAAAASAYDAAFANYAQLAEEERPWRMLWYQTGPYFAYYYTGRFQDVIDLATTTLEAMSDPILEESYYWRAQAYIATAQFEAAADDLRLCLEAHPGFTPCEEELEKLGIEP